MADDWNDPRWLSKALAAKDEPGSFASRYHFVEALLSATTVETCPCCGQEVVKPAPLISRETALRMLESTDATEP